MFASDRDLVAIEPNLFRDGGPAAQRLVAGVCSISGTTLTLTSQDVDLEAAGVGAGYVALVDGTPYEVVARLSATTATISRLRVSVADAVLPPTPGTGKPVEVRTFRPQLALMHGQLLRMVGIDPSDPAAALTEDAILNPGALAEVEALGAVYLAYTFAAGWTAGEAWPRGQIYLQRYEQARQLVVVQLDTDGDGLADATRRLNVMQLRRA
jgi:hypothetical protein